MIISQYPSPAPSVFPTKPKSDPPLSLSLSPNQGIDIPLFWGDTQVSDAFIPIPVLFPLFLYSPTYLPYLHRCRYVFAQTMSPHPLSFPSPPDPKPGGGGVHLLSSPRLPIPLPPPETPGKNSHKIRYLVGAPSPPFVIFCYI